MFIAGVLTTRGATEMMVWFWACWVWARTVAWCNLPGGGRVSISSISLQASCNGGGNVFILSISLGNRPACGGSVSISSILAWFLRSSGGASVAGRVGIWAMRESEDRLLSMA